MDRHTDGFLSDEDIARFAKGRIFLGEPLPDGDGTLAKMPRPLEPIYILPTADQYRSIRENEERRSRLKGGLRVRVESLPIVYDESSAQDKAIGCSEQKTNVQKNVRREVQHETSNEQIISHNISCLYTSDIHSKEVDGDGDALISRLDENEKCELKLRGRIPGSSENRRGDSWLERKSDVPVKNDATSFGGESYDSNMNHSYVPDIEKSETEEDKGQSSEEEISDALISSDEDEEDDEGAWKQQGRNNERGKEPHATSMLAASSDNGRHTNPIASCGAIGRSIMRTKMDNSGDWHDRRSVATVVLSRIKRTRQRSLLKRPRTRQRTVSGTGNSTEGDSALPTGGNAVPRRTTLRFAAARKKQTTLRTMFKK